MKLCPYFVLLMLLAACGGIDDGPLAEDEAAAQAGTGNTPTHPAPTRPMVAIQPPPEMATCTVTFANAFSLLFLPNTAADTFALDPWWIESCGFYTTSIRVEPVAPYEHFHLSFEDPTITCYDLDANGLGRMINGECVAPDAYYLEPRYLQTHLPDESVRIWVYQQGHPVWFNLENIRIKGQTPARLRYRYEGEETWHSLMLNPGYVTLPNALQAVIEVELRAWNASGASVLSLDDITIDVPKLF